MPADVEALYLFQSASRQSGLVSHCPEDNGTLEYLKTRIEQAKPYQGIYLIRDAAGGIIASCGFYKVLFRSRFGFLHLHLAQSDEQGECLSHFLELAFVQLGFHKINAYLAEETLALFDALSRRGFREEVRMREHLCRGGSFEDVFHLGLLRGEYTGTGGSPAQAPVVGPGRRNKDYLIKTNVAADRYLLQGDRVSLTMIDREDLDGLYEQMCASNAEQFSSVAAVGPHSRQSLQWMSDKRNDYHNLAGDLMFAIRKRDSAQMVGTINAHFVDTANANLMLGIGIYQSGERNRGFGSEAIRLLTDFAFLEMNMHRVYLGCFSFNQRAAALYERLGFRREGINRGFVYRNGNYYDEIAFGVTRAQWLALRGYLADGPS